MSQRAGICNWRLHAARRSRTLGAILVSTTKTKQKRDSCLKFAGKVGSGFTAKALSILSRDFAREERDECRLSISAVETSDDWSESRPPMMPG